MKKILLLLSIVCGGQIHGQTSLGKKITPSQTNSNVVLYDSIYHWTLDTTIGTWNVYSKSVNFVYNAHQNEVSNIEQNWSGTAWVNKNQYFFSYDTLFEEISKITQNWNGSIWANNSRDTLIYNSIHNKILDLSQTWSGSSWTTNMVDTFTYDTSNNMTSDLTEGLGVWYYTYDSNHNLTYASSQYWDSQNNNWTFGASITFTYNINNSVTSEYITSCCGPHQLYTCTYDTLNNLIIALSQLQSGMNWVNFEQLTYTYYSNNIMKTKVAKYFNGAGTVVTGGDSAVYYLNAPEGINQLSKNNQQMLFYPNPTSDQFIIDANTTDKLSVCLYDVNGRCMLTQSIEPTYFDKLSTGSNPSKEGNSNSIDVSSLNEGVYTLTIKTANSVVNKKLVIVR